MTYAQEIELLFKELGIEAVIYQQVPVKVVADSKPLTKAQRAQVDLLSKERGYRRFTADMRQ
jgi:hypothetical protein